MSFNIDVLKNLERTMERFEAVPNLSIKGKFLKKQLEEVKSNLENDKIDGEFAINLSKDVFITNLTI